MLNADERLLSPNPFGLGPEDLREADTALRCALQELVVACRANNVSSAAIAPLMDVLQRVVFSPMMAEHLSIRDWLAMGAEALKVVALLEERVGVDRERIAMDLVMRWVAAGHEFTLPELAKEAGFSTRQNMMNPTTKNGIKVPRNPDLVALLNKLGMLTPKAPKIGITDADLYDLNGDDEPVGT